MLANALNVVVDWYNAMTEDNPNWMKENYPEFGKIVTERILLSLLFMTINGFNNFNLGRYYQYSAKM